MKIIDVEAELALRQDRYRRYAPNRYAVQSSDSTENKPPKSFYFYDARSRVSDRQSIDALIGQGEVAVTAADPVTAMLGDRLHANWLAVDDTIVQIHRRYEIYEQHVRQIEQSRLSTLNLMHSFPKLFDRVSPSDYQVIHRMLSEIDLQRRAERLDLWRDVSRLRQTLPELTQSYLSGVRKMDVLHDDVTGGVA